MAAAEASPETRLETILIVEDEILVRMVIADYLRECGYRVIEAGNAAEAIKVLRSPERIDIVFSDVQMPGTMDGLRLVSLIRDRWPPIRLILTSGKALPAGETLPKDCTFIPKPYSLENLTDALRKGPMPP